MRDCERTSYTVEWAATLKSNSLPPLGLISFHCSFSSSKFRYIKVLKIY